MRIKSIDPERAISLIMDMGISRNDAIAILLSLGLRRMRNGDWGTEGESDFEFNLQDIDPYHLIEISAYEIAYRKVRSKDEKSFYIGTRDDISTILGYAMSRGVEVLSSMSFDSPEDLIRQIVDDYWPE